MPLSRFIFRLIAPTLRRHCQITRRYGCRLPPPDYVATAMASDTGDDGAKRDNATITMPLAIDADYADFAPRLLR